MIKLDVNFSRYNLSIEAKIWNKKENKFEEIDALFDTGAHTCAIDLDLFLNLGYDLDDARKSFISTASSSRETAHRIRIEQMMLDNTVLKDVTFNTFEFPVVSRPIIIGMNILRQFEVSMNFKNKMIIMQENYLCENDDYYCHDIFGDWRVDNIGK